MVKYIETTPMEPDKLGRWLGWIRACVVMANIGMTLEDMKKINEKFL